MAFHIYENKSGGKSVQIGRRLWLTKDGRLVEDGDSEAYSLFCGAGDRVSEAELEARGGLPRAKSATTSKRRSKKAGADEADASDEKESSDG